MEHLEKTNKLLVNILEMKRKRFGEKKKGGIFAFLKNV
jgi:hypothetical protein